MLTVAQQTSELSPVFFLPPPEMLQTRCWLLASPSSLALWVFQLLGCESAAMAMPISERNVLKGRRNSGILVLKFSSLEMPWLSRSALSSLEVSPGHFFLSHGTMFRLFPSHFSNGISVCPIFPHCLPFIQPLRQTPDFVFLS